MDVLSESVSQSVSVSNPDEVYDKVNDEVRLKMNVGPLLAGAEGAAHVSPARGAGIL